MKPYQFLIIFTDDTGETRMIIDAFATDETDEVLQLVSLYEHIRTNSGRVLTKDNLLFSKVLPMSDQAMRLVLNYADSVDM